MGPKPPVECILIPMQLAQRRPQCTLKLKLKLRLKLKWMPTEQTGPIPRAWQRSTAGWWDSSTRSAGSQNSASRPHGSAQGAAGSQQLAAPCASAEPV